MTAGGAVIEIRLCVSFRIDASMNKLPRFKNLLTPTCCVENLHAVTKQVMVPVLDRRALFLCAVGGSRAVFVSSSGKNKLPLGCNECSQDTLMHNNY